MTEQWRDGQFEKSTSMKVVSAPTVAACRQFKPSARGRERTNLSTDVGDERVWSLGSPNRTHLHRRLTVTGPNLNCFSFPDLTLWNFLNQQEFFFFFNCCYMMFFLMPTMTLLTTYKTE